MTNESPKNFHGRLYSLLGEAGVELVLCPHMPGTGIQGATFWMGLGRAVLMMTLRYKWADIFWFSLFHELGHILLHGRKVVFLEEINGDKSQSRKEKEAYRFAQTFLIPPDKYQKFVIEERFYKENIEAFARLIGVDPGIVVGRLQHENRIQNHWQNGLRKRFEWQQEQPPQQYRPLVFRWLDIVTITNPQFS